MFLALSICSIFFSGKFNAKINRMFNPEVRKKFQKPRTAYTHELSALGTVNTMVTLITGK